MSCSFLLQANFVKRNLRHNTPEVLLLCKIFCPVFTSFYHVENMFAREASASECLSLAWILVIFLGIWYNAVTNDVTVYHVCAVKRKPPMAVGGFFFMKSLFQQINVYQAVIHVLDLIQSCWNLAIFLRMWYNASINEVTACHVCAAERKPPMAVGGFLFLFLGEA